MSLASSLARLFAAGTGLVPAGAVMPYALSSPPSGWLACDGAAVSRTTYSALFAALVKSATVTISIASPGVVTWTGHGRSAGDPIKISTTGALPTGLTAGTTYFVKTVLDANSFTLAATSGGTVINTSGSQSGTHTAVHAPYGTGDGSTTFNVPDLRGEFIRGLDAGRGVDANRSIGSAQAEMVGPHTHPVSAAMPGIGSSGSINRSASNNPVGASVVSDANTGTENRPRNVGLLYCIKT